MGKLTVATLTTATLPMLVLFSDPAKAQTGAMTSDLDVSLRLGVEFQSEPDADFAVRNYASRLRWSGSADLDSGGTVIGYLELGVAAGDVIDGSGDIDSGIDNTRQAWVGMTGNKGTLKIGKQYSALYDAVTAKVDIAYWGSCYFELQCARQTSTVKYASVPDDGLQLHGSTQLVFDADDAELLNGFDLAVTMDSEELSIGAGLSYLGEGNGRIDNGFALSVAASKEVGEGMASAALSFATDDYIQQPDDGIALTGTYTQGDVYGVIGITSATTDPFYLTAGYVRQLIADRAFLYFEIGIEDQDVDGEDAALTARSVLVFNFGKNYSSDQ